MFLPLFGDLADGLKNGMGKGEKAIFFFAGLIVPPYCQTRFVGMRGDLPRAVHG